MKEVLIVEDNSEVSILIGSILSDYELTFASNIDQAKKALSKKYFDLLLLDIGLPDGDGLQFLTQLKATKEEGIKEHPSIIILSGKQEVSNKVLAFALGAEDFITKPFDIVEFRARVDSKIKKVDREKGRLETLKVGDIHIHVAKQKVTLMNPLHTHENISLTSIEFRILVVLGRHPENIFTREQLLNEVWGMNVHIADRTVDTHIGNLRKKLAHSNVRIDTVIGSGYRILC